MPLPKPMTVLQRSCLLVLQGFQERPAQGSVESAQSLQSQYASQYIESSHDVRLRLSRPSAQQSDHVADSKYPSCRWVPNPSCVSVARNDEFRYSPRMVKQVVRCGRNERGPEAYSVRYVEGPSDARIKLAACFTILGGREEPNDDLRLRQPQPARQHHRSARQGRDLHLRWQRQSRHASHPQGRRHPVCL